MPDDELIGSATASRLLNKDRSTLSRWVGAGRIAPAFRLEGGAMVFRRAEVEALAEELDTEAVDTEAAS